MKHFATLILLLTSLPSFGSDYGELTEQFFNLIESNESVKAINYIYNGNDWIDVNSDEVLHLKDQLNGIEKLVGKYMFYELISENKVGSKYAHLIYLVGYERQPVRFQIKLYKPNGEWRFQGLSFDTNLTDDINKEVNLDLVK